MADVFNEFYGAVVSAILTALPELSAQPVGIFEGAQAVFLPEASLTPPYASVEVEEWAPTDEYGSGNATWLGQVSIWLVIMLSPNRKMSVLRTKLKALSDELWWNDGLGDAGQIMEEPRIAYEDTLGPNMPISEQMQSVRAGRVMCSVLVGEGQ